MTRLEKHLPLSRDAIAIALLALVFRLVLCIWAWDRVPPTADGAFYHVVAERIAEGKGYTWLWPDGVVSYAAHYPIGYPALMGLVYWLVGPVPGAVMVFNAFLGALAVWAVHGLAQSLVRASPWYQFERQGSATAALLLAFSPTLLGYTPALMTEGAVGAFLILAARTALVLKGETVRGEERAPVAKNGRLWSLVMILCVAAATLLRPQSVVLAPVLGWLSSFGAFRSRLLKAALVSVGCLLVVSPWTLRNCDKMERCIFVSANGGWNLLIGTFPEGRGAWVALEGERVPIECREVYHEAEKDSCFGHAGLKRILHDPLPWTKMVPAKLKATFDHSAAAAEYLSSAGALSESGRTWLMASEYLFQRSLFLLSLLGAWVGCGLFSSRVRNFLVLVGVVGFAGISVPLGWFATLALLGGSRRNTEQVGIVFGAFSLMATLAIHSVFFGAGRYSLPLLFAVAPLSALGAAFLCKSFAIRQRKVEDFDTQVIGG